MRIEELLSIEVTFIIFLQHSCRLIHGVLISTSALDAAITQLHDLCAVFESGEAVGDDEQGKVIAEALDSFHDGLFGFIVQRTGGFVKNDDIGLLVQGAGNADTLALTTREADAAFTDEGLVLLGPRFDAVGDLRLLGGIPDSLMIDLIFGYAKGNVFFNGAVGQKYGLRHMSDMGLPGAVICERHRLAINLQGAIGWL